MTRDTSTGAAFKEVVQGILASIANKNGLTVARRVVVGTKPNGQQNVIDFTVTRNSNDNFRGLVSCRSQSVGGSAEEKVAFEVIRLLHTMSLDSRYRHAWVVLGGTGWSDDLVDFYTDEMATYVPDMKKKITILRTDELLSANITV